ncbi:MAG: hypothetical protein QM690_14505 [Sphingobium sp.]
MIYQPPTKALPIWRLTPAEEAIIEDYWMGLTAQEFRRLYVCEFVPDHRPDQKGERVR